MLWWDLMLCCFFFLWILIDILFAKYVYNSKYTLTSLIFCVAWCVFWSFLCVVLCRCYCHHGAYYFDPYRSHWALADLSPQECITSTPTRAARPTLCWPTAAFLPHQNRPAFILRSHRYEDITRGRLQEIAPLDQWARSPITAMLWKLNVSLRNCQSVHTLVVMTETPAVGTWSRDPLSA